MKHVRIEYWVEKAETGIHFNGNVLHTDNQLRRARCWFPCLDDNLQCCWYLQGQIANLKRFYDILFLCLWQFILFLVQLRPRIYSGQ